MVMVAVPSQLEQFAAVVLSTIPLKADGSLIVMASVISQAFASVMVTVAKPAARAVAVDVVSPFDQE